MEFAGEKKIGEKKLMISYLQEQDSPRAGGNLWLKKENRIGKHCVAINVPEEVVTAWFRPSQLTMTEIKKSLHK